MKDNINQFVKEYNQSKSLSLTNYKEQKFFIDHPSTFKIYINESLAGYAYIRKFSKSYFDIGPILVLSKFKGMGVGKELLKKILLNYPDKYLIATTINPVMEYLLVKNGFIKIRFFDLPIRVRILFLLRKLNLKRLWGFYKKGTLFKRWKSYLFAP